MSNKSFDLPRFILLCAFTLTLGPLTKSQALFFPTPDPHTHTTPNQSPHTNFRPSIRILGLHTISWPFTSNLGPPTQSQAAKI